MKEKIEEIKAPLIKNESDISKDFTNYCTSNNKYNHNLKHLNKETRLPNKKVKFSKVYVIKVPSWKKYNINSQARESFDDFISKIKLKKAKKDIKCSCLII